MRRKPPLDAAAVVARRRRPYGRRRNDLATRKEREEGKEYAMNDEPLLRALEDEPERGTDLLGAVEAHLRDLCALLAESPVDGDTVQIPRSNLLLRVIDAETIRLMIAEGMEYDEAYSETCDRFHGPDQGVGRAEGYLEAFDRRAEQRRR